MPVSTESYSTLLRRVRDLDGAVFTAREAQRMRDAADARLFGDDDQAETAKRALAMLDGLVDAARLSRRTASALADLLDEIESF